MKARLVDALSRAGIAIALGMILSIVILAAIGLSFVSDPEGFAKTWKGAPEESTVTISTGIVTPSQPLLSLPDTTGTGNVTLHGFSNDSEIIVRNKVRVEVNQDDIITVPANTPVATVLCLEMVTDRRACATVGQWVIWASRKGL
jgi:hypothetical protein